LRSEEKFLSVGFRRDRILIAVFAILIFVTAWLLQGDSSWCESFDTSSRPEPGSRRSETPFEPASKHQGARIVARSGLEEPVHDPFEATLQSGEVEAIADPLEPVNRVFFAFNDKLYFWILKPVALGYRRVVPETVRIGIGNFFSNVRMPIRAFNCVLQGKIDGFGNELLRFFVNSSAGMLGFADVAGYAWDLGLQDEDLGQTLGRLGFGPGCYIAWPILGPSSLRDTFGFLGDGFLNPINYLVDQTGYNLAVNGFRTVNQESLTIGEYESLKKAALDPYVAFRDAYYQYRKNKIRN
jgi:phospholipid-binding lipoprotein MlaA